MRLLFNRFLAVLFGTSLAYFYRYSRIRHTTGRDRIPRNRPILFCSNHPNAFMDALVLGSSTPQHTYFLVRSDVMRKPLLRAFLDFTSLIPIYRIQEGVENLSKNDETFLRCAEKLEKNKGIIIFSEGLCVPERRLRKLKKGTARIAFGTEEKNDFKLGLVIVPVGLNYTWPASKFRSGLHIRFGEPFEVREFEELYRTEKAKAINEFTRRLETAMAKELVVIPDKANDELVTQLESIVLHDWSVEKNRRPRNAKETFETTQEIVDITDAASKAEPEKFAAFRDKVAKYSRMLKAHNLRDHLLRPASILRMGLWDLLEDFLFFSFGFPFWLYGVVNNYLAYKIPMMVTKRVVKSEEWISSINGSVGTVTFLIFYLVQFFLCAKFFGWWIALAYLVSLPLTGHFAWMYWVRMLKSRGKGNLLKLMRKDRDKVEELLGLRADIVAEAEEYKSRFGK